MNDILSVAEAAKLLGCSEDTLREKTPAVVPGVKFGRDWVYSRALIVEAVERESRQNLIRLREKQQAAESREIQDVPSTVGRRRPPSLTP